jgi:hypothetical protein
MNTDGQPVSASILIEGELPKRILGAAFKVLSTLDAGVLENENEITSFVFPCESVVPKSQVSG